MQRVRKALKLSFCLLLLTSTVLGQSAEPPMPPPDAATTRPAESRVAARWQAKDVPVPDRAVFVPEPGERPPAITLAELEQTALANNPSLVEFGMRVRAAQGEYAQAGLYPNPVLGYIGDEMGQEGRAGQQGAFVGQEIVTGGKRGLARAVASHDIQRAQYTFEAQRWRVINDVRSGFYEVLAAQRGVALNEELVRTSEQTRKVAEQLLAAKEVGRTDLIQARIETESARIQLQTAQNRSQAAWRQLATVVGVPNMPSATLAGGLEDGLPEIAWESSLQRLLTESPELAEARSAVERARCAVARECAERTPNVNVETNVRYDNATENTIAGVQLGVPLPIFNRNQGNIAKAQSQLVGAQSAVRRAELQLQNRLAAAFERYANARQQVERYRTEILPGAKESLELVRKGYQQGEFNYLVVLTAQRTYFRVNLAYLDSLRELRTSAVAIEGLLLSGGLQTESASTSEPQRSRTEVPIAPLTP